MFDVTLPNVTKKYSQLIIDTKNLPESTRLGLLQVDTREETMAQICGVGCSFSICRHEKLEALFVVFRSFFLVAHFLSPTPIFLNIKTCSLTYWTDGGG